jgi:hypothetical protein
MNRHIRVRSTGAWRRKLQDAESELMVLDFHCILEVVELLDEIKIEKVSSCKYW